jgi:hypothetical protein
MHPAWSLELLPVVGISASCPGGAIEAPVAFNGDTQVIEFSGGGRWKIEMRRVQLHAGRPDGHRLWNRLRARLESGVGRITVPVFAKIIQPDTVERISFDDGTLLAGGVGHVASTLLARIAAPVTEGWATVTLEIMAGEAPYDPMMFGVFTPADEWRCHQIIGVDEDVVADDGRRLVTVGIKPPFRTDLAAGTFVDFHQPRTTVRLPAGGQMPWEPEKNWRAQPSVVFYEAMG